MWLFAWQQKPISIQHLFKINKESTFLCRGRCNMIQLQMMYSNLVRGINREDKAENQHWSWETPSLILFYCSADHAKSKRFISRQKKGASSQIQVCNAQRVSTEANAAPTRLSHHPSRRTGRQMINMSTVGTLQDMLRTFVLLALLQLKLYNAFEICAYCGKLFFFCV